MSRITKEIATEVAKTLTKGKKDEYEALEKQLSETVRDLYNETIPDEVKLFQQKFPSFINVRGSVELKGNGFSYEYVVVKPSVITNTNECTCLYPTPDQAKTLQQIKNKIYDLKKEYNTLFLDIENALLSLRTYSKIEKEFPEAFVLLPNRISTALAININSIREKLPQQAA